MDFMLEKRGWVLSERQPDQIFTRYEKGESLLDIFNTGTIRFIKEPWGKTEYFKEVSLEDALEAVDRLLSQ